MQSSSTTPTTENEILKRQIRDWISVDNELRRLKKEVRQRTDEKERMTLDLMENMKRRNIDVVNLTDGHLRYQNQKVKKPITQKMLLNLLSTYFQGDVQEAEKVNTFLIENRPEVIRESLVRKVNP